MIVGRSAARRSRSWRSLGSRTLATCPRLATMRRRPSGAIHEEGLSVTSAPAPVLRKHGNAYNIFILVLTIFSLAIMVLSSCR